MASTASGNLFLVGFSMTGKTRVGQQVARRLGWDFVDTDEQVAARAGKPVPRIFAEEGEPRFRELERQVLQDVCQGSGQVVSTGGGAVLDPANREAMAQAGVVVLLEASPETIYRRLMAAQDTEVARPLLEGADPLARIVALKEYRQPFYALAADWTVHTDHLHPSEVTYEVVRGWRFGSRRFRSLPKVSSPSTQRGEESKAPYCQAQGAAGTVTTSSGSYPVFVGWGLLDELGRRMKNAGLSGTACLVSDETVFSHYGPKVEAILREAGFDVVSFTVKPGEASKSLDSAARIYDGMVERRIERGHPVVALGGGVVGDLAGFVAATFLRGLPFVQVPTSLLAMVDASIGGKVAVDHPQGKNLIGAFYQPRLVLADVQTLATLPPRELRSGWAEVVKHGLILDSAYFSWLEASLPKLTRLDGEATAEAVRRSAAIKAQVVTEDEKETGKRTLLNYGHTLGHALEAAAGYEGFLHGEAVAIGMMGAALLSHRLGMVSSEVAERQEALLKGFGLPTRAPGVDKGRVLAAMELDKKVRGKKVRWVLLEGLGKAVIRERVPQETVLGMLQEILS